MAPGPLAVDVVVEQLRRRPPGGIGTYCHGLLQGLRALGADSPAIRLRASRAPSRPDPLVDEGFPLACSRLPGPLLTRLWDRGLPVGFAAGRPGVVHATSFAFPPVRGGLVAMVHDLAWRRFPDAYPPRGRAWHEAALRRLADRAELLIVPSELTAADLLGAGLGLGPDRLRVVGEGLDHLAPPDTREASAFLSRHGVAPSEPFLLTVSTLEPRKNLARLAEAYAAVRPHLPEPWPLVVVGPAGWGEGAPAPAPGIVATGPAPPAVLSGLYGLCRLLAYVPLFEGFGLPAGEAMAAGAPVVASAGLPSTAGACLEVGPEDVSQIADGLLRAATDEELRARLVEAGAERAASLTWEGAARAHVAAWQEMAGR